MSGYNPLPPENNNKGFWNANLNVPNYAVELEATGDYLIVATAGTQTIETIEINFSEGEYLVKIDSGFSKISPTDPSFTGFTNGDFIKVVDNVATKSDIRQLDDVILMGETVRNKQGSVEIGVGTRLSEYGGLFTAKSAITDNKYLPIVSQVEAGTVDPFANDKAFRSSIGTFGDVILQATDTELLENVTSVDITSLPYLNTLSKFYFDFANTPTNLRIRVKRTNGTIIKYFPDEFAWIDEVGGIDITSTGKQEVYPLGSENGTPMMFPASTDYIIEMVADSAINLNGSLTDPWTKAEVAPTEFIELCDNGVLPELSYTLTSHIDGLDVSILYPKGLLKVDSTANLELRSLTGGLHNQSITIMNLSLKDLKLKNESGTYQMLRVEGDADKTMSKYGGATIVYDSVKGYWYVVGIIT